MTQKHQQSKALLKIMWYLSSLNWEENPGRYFDPRKCNIYKGMVHYAGITSGIALLWKLTSVTDLITKQPATTSNIYFSNPRWILTAHVSPPSFSRAPLQVPAQGNYGRPLPTYITHRAHPIAQASCWWNDAAIYREEMEKGTNTACHN